tara:strand:+ start:867 stop:1298 length:432 start_codon:yes stop_codon:yes gene_type:complete
MLDHKFFREVGTQIREAYRTHTFTKALDVNDKPFSSNYNPKYKQLKQSGKLPRQQKGFGKLNSPIVSTDLLRDFGSIYKTSATGFQMGWSSKGEVVESLVKKRRLLTTKEQPLPKAIEKLLDKEQEKYVDKKFGPDKTFRYRR